MVHVILLTHGTLGRSLMDSVMSVLGPQPDSIVLTNSGRSLEQIRDSLIPHLSDAPTIIFVDFCGGSPYMACQTLHYAGKETVVISGVNLPMLLSFFTKREKLSFSELVEAVKSDGARGIQLYHPE
jgi:PTS system mannose-specific IIA component